MRKTPEFKAKRKVYRQRPDVRVVERDRRRLRKAMLRREAYRADGTISEVLSLEGKFTRADWLALLKEFDHSCAYCGVETKMTFEHLTPLSRGGKNQKGNIVPACLPCNSSKQDRTVEEYAPDRAQEIRDRAMLN
jgi:5-methylcytosine-specific restriction endonuclease McrA